MKMSLLCPICNFILKDAVQTVDGIRLCETCFKEIAQYPDCKCNRTGISVMDDTGKACCFPDKTVRCEIQHTVVLCKNSSCGCPWSGTLSEYDAHEKECNFNPVSCPNGCQKSLLSSEVDNHVTMDCCYREVICEHCGEVILPAVLETHTKECPKSPTVCSLCSDEVTREKLKEHESNDCSKVQCSCGDVLNKEGTDSDQDTVEAHFDNPAAVLYHILGVMSVATMLMDFVSSIDERLSAIEGDISAQSSSRTHTSSETQPAVTIQSPNLLERNSDASTDDRNEPPDEGVNGAEPLNVAAPHDVVHERQDNNNHHNVADVIYSNQRTPAQYIRQLTERVQREMLAIPERKGQDVRFTVVKQAAGTTLEKEMKAYLDRPPPPDDSTHRKANSYRGFLQFVFESVHWNDSDSVKPLQQFLMTLEATAGIDLNQEILLVGVLLDNLKPPSPRKEGEVDYVQVFVDLPEQAVVHGDVSNPDPPPDLPLNTVLQLSVNVVQGSEQNEPTALSMDMDTATTHVNEAESKDAETINDEAQTQDLEARINRLQQRTKAQESTIKKLQSLMCSGTQYSADATSRIALLVRKCAEFESQVSSTKIHVSELELQLQASLASTYNGSYIWRIPDISRRRRDAIDGRTLSLYSPPFYTGRHGYKMCIRAYLNGDGTGRGTHISLFFVLMKGEFDALLEWPFTHKVSFILIDQDHRRHIVQTFKPDPMSSSFCRPVSDMNVASGCPQFARRNVFDEDSYVKDDAMFFKCIMDTSHIFHP